MFVTLVGTFLHQTQRLLRHVSTVAPKWMKLNTDSAYWTFKHRSFAYTIFYIIQGPADTLNKKGSAREGHRREA